MDPISLVLGAILAGAAKGGGTAASKAVADLYEAFRDALKRRLSGRKSAEVAVEEYTEDPDSWRGVLDVYLRQAGVDSDRELIAAASAVLSATDPKGAALGRYSFQIVGTSAVQAGDHNQQRNYFGDRSPSGPE